MSNPSPIHENWLEGVPCQNNGIIPAILASQWLQKRTETGVRQLATTTLRLFEQWKLDHGDKPQMGLLGDPIEIADAKPWLCAGFGVQDPVDLLLHIEQQHYEPILKLIKDEGKEDLLAALALSQLAEASAENDGHFDFFQNDRRTIAAMKAALHISLSSNEAIIKNRVLYMLNKVAPRLVDEGIANAKSEAARAAAAVRNAPFKALEQKAVEMFNEKDPPFSSMRQGARQIIGPLKDYATDNDLGWLTTDEPWVQVYKWIRKANKAGLLKKS